MTIKKSQIKFRQFTAHEKIRNAQEDITTISVEANVQDYFTKGLVKQIDDAEIKRYNLRKYRRYETEWELIDQLSNGDPQPNWVFYAWKGWNIDFGNIPENQIPFIDVKILWRNRGYNNDYIPGFVEQGYFFEVTDTQDDTIKSVVLHAILYFNENTLTAPFANQTPTSNASIEAKLLITFLYPQDLF